MELRVPGPEPIEVPGPGVSFARYLYLDRYIPFQHLLVQSRCKPCLHRCQSSPSISVQVFPSLPTDSPRILSSSLYSLPSLSASSTLQIRPLLPIHPCTLYLLRSPSAVPRPTLRNLCPPTLPSLVSSTPLTRAQTKWRRAFSLVPPFLHLLPT